MKRVLLVAAAGTAAALVIAATALSQSSSTPKLVGTVGPDHRKQFQVEVAVRGEPLAEAVGPSKKEAEQEAARVALEKLARGGE